MNAILRTPSSRRGFTLVEVLFVIVLMTIIAAITVPRMSGMIAVGESKRAMDQVAADLQWARLSAVRRAGSVEFRFGSPPSAYEIVWAPPGGTEQVLRRTDLQRDFGRTSVELGTGMAATLTFDSRGLIADPNALGDGVIVIRTADRSSRLRLTATGGVYRDDS